MTKNGDKLLVQLYKNKLIWAEDYVMNIQAKPNVSGEGFVLCYIVWENEDTFGVTVMPYISGKPFHLKYIEEWLSKQLSHNRQSNDYLDSSVIEDKSIITVSKKHTFPFTVPPDWIPSHTSPTVLSIGLNDCADLHVIDFPSVLFNLRRRYEGISKDHSITIFGTLSDNHQKVLSPTIYTFAGSVLLSINPYGLGHGNDDTIDLNIFEKSRVRDLPPHPFSIAELCFRRLIQGNTCQTIVVSGDSGAGKTETAKTMMRYLAIRGSRDPVLSSSVTSDMQENSQTNSSMDVFKKTQERLLGMNPILEGFGNAATMRNSNSSRFGRLNKLYFKNSTLIGAGVQTYLLERSRVTHQNSNERNFHVFYQLLQGCSDKLLHHLGLTRQPENYSILVKPSLYTPSHDHMMSLQKNATHSLVEDDCSTPLPYRSKHHSDDRGRFALLRSALLLNGFSEQIVVEMFEILAAILHLGNITETDVMSPYLKTLAPIQTASRLLRISADALTQLIQCRRLAIDGKIAPRPISSRLPMVCTLIRWMYSRLFEEIIIKYLDGAFTQDDRFVAILDIYGFEDLQQNSYEQLLINLANEKLQHFFVHHLIIAEQLKYKDQHISWKPITVCTGEHVTRCITGRAPQHFLPLKCLSDIHHSKKSVSLTTSASRGVSPGRLNEDCPAILRYLDDVGLVAAGDVTGESKKHDEGFWKKLQSLQTVHSSVFRWNPKKNTDMMTFVVRHFAGDVTYTVEDWIVKDNDKIAPEVQACFTLSSSFTMKQMVESDIVRVNKIGRFSPVAKKFNIEVDLLLKNLSSTGLSFVKCFLPNMHQQKGLFDGRLITRQMRQSGTLELLQLCQLGYPFHQEYRFIHEHFSWLLQQCVSTLTHPHLFVSQLDLEKKYPLLKYSKFLAECVLRLFVPKNRSDWEIGKTLLFARSPLDESLRQLMTVSTKLPASSFSSLVETLHWHRPTLLELTHVYSHIALRPWRRIVQPLTKILSLFRMIRRRRFIRIFTTPMMRLSFLHWKFIIQDMQHYKHTILTDSNHSVQFLNENHTIQHYPTPWFFAWKQSIFKIENTTSCLFFDGIYVWIQDQSCTQTLESHQHHASIRAERLYFQRRHQINGNRLQRLSGPSRRRPSEHNFQHKQIEKTDSNRLTTYSVEDSILTLQQHPILLHTFCVLSTSLCLGIFHTQTLSTQEQEKKNVSIHSSTNPLHDSTFLTSPISFLPIGRRCLDMTSVIKKYFSTGNHQINIDRLYFLKLIFPYQDNDAIILILWLLNKPSMIYGTTPSEEGVLTLIDLNEGSLLSFLFFKLPSFQHVLKSVKLNSVRRWSSLYPRYADMSTRPTYLTVLEASIIYPLSSNRGVIWAGAGFCNVFRLINLLDVSAKTKAVNIQLIWDISHHNPPNHPKQTDRIIQSQWIFWASSINSILLTPNQLTPPQHFDSTSLHSSQKQHLVQAHTRHFVLSKSFKEIIIIGTLCGTLLHLTLSLSKNPLTVESVQRFTLDVPSTNLRSGILSLFPFPCVLVDNSFVSVFVITYKGILLKLKLNLDQSICLVMQQSCLNTAISTQLDNEVDLRHYKLTAITIQQDETLERFSIMASDLPSGSIQTWIVNNKVTSTGPMFIVRHMLSGSVRYARHLLSCVTPYVKTII